MIGAEPFLLCFGDPDLAARIARFGLPVALFLAGLAGSLIHCLGMCGPFVLGQVAAGLDGVTAEGYGELQRLRRGALLPYHLGRLITYGGLGALAGALGGAVLARRPAAWLAALLLALAALALLAQSLPRLGASLPALPILPGLATRIARLASPPQQPGFFALLRFGILLGFLPCGFLWGGLAAAASSGGAVAGGAAMAGFALGTMPALVGLGWSGLLFARQSQPWLRRLAPLLQSLNAGFLLWLSARLVAGL